jgi:hypothetical protein
MKIQISRTDPISGKLLVKGEWDEAEIWMQGEEQTNSMDP